MVETNRKVCGARRGQKPSQLDCLLASRLHSQQQATRWIEDAGERGWEVGVKGGGEGGGRRAEGIRWEGYDVHAKLTFHKKSGDCGLT